MIIAGGKRNLLLLDQWRDDAACRRGILIKARSIASTRSIFKNGLDRPFLDETSKGAVDHRGPLSGKHIGLSHYPLRHWL